ncbi:MAG: apolipoprotein N-acyltransferase, partial [Bdellovibrionia bacterium]
LFRQPYTQLETVINERVENYVRDHGVPLLFGGYDRQHNKEFNTFFFLQPTGQLQTYHKSKLLMFGEYIPGAESIQFFKDAFPQVGNFGHGVGPQVLELTTQNGNKTTRVAPIICYEALFTNFLVDSARNNSQLILNITNDSWFGQWGEPQLHLALTIFRSIETRLPMLRSTNTGISTLITANGEITHATGIGTQEIMNVNVPITPPIWSLVKAWGDWFGPFALVMGLLGLAILCRMLGLAHFENLLNFKRNRHAKLISKIK